MIYTSVFSFVHTSSAFTNYYYKFNYLFPLLCVKIISHPDGYRDTK